MGFWSYEMQTKYISLNVNKRAAKGAFLIEVLVAVAICGIVLVCMGNSISELLRLSVTTQNRYAASSLCQSVIERLRAAPVSGLNYDQLYKMQISSNDPRAIPPNSLLGRYLQIDYNNFVWSGTSLPEFKGEVTVKVSPYLLVENLDIAEVRATWSDSSSPNQENEYKLTALIAKRGIRRK
ncbi:MAG: hypothetical protein LCH63_03170 [Candidatus Melainabacteria bacterium]|nr:hypothetical protein [Candidatus Melainabacteria bacterium]